MSTVLDVRSGHGVDIDPGRAEDDLLWKYVKKEPNNGWQCSFCERKFKGGISKIKAHLAGDKGQGIAVCERVPDEVIREASRHKSGNKGEGIAVGQKAAFSMRRSRILRGGKKGKSKSSKGSDLTSTGGMPPSWNRHDYEAIYDPPWDMFSGTESRQRDFISLILSYPMRVGHESMLKRWMNGIFESHVSDCAQAFHDQWPKGYVERLIPNEIISDMTFGCSIFGISQRLTSSLSIFPSESNSTSKGEQEPGWTDLNSETQEAVFDSAVDLAVRQLIQTLVSEDDYTRHIHSVLLSSRNDAENRAVMKKIEAALEDEDNKLEITEEFQRVIWIDASQNKSNFVEELLQVPELSGTTSDQEMKESDIEDPVLPEIAQKVELSGTTSYEMQDENATVTSSVEDGMTSQKKYLIFIEDGNGKLDFWKKHFTNKKFAGVLVLISTRYSARFNPRLPFPVDLEIRTEDHVLPWELFCWAGNFKHIFSSVAIQHLAVQIVKECRGHLLAIALVASFLKDMKDIELWKSALENLRYTCGSHVIDGMSGVMVNAVKNFIWKDSTEIERHWLTHCLSVPNITEGIKYDLLISHWAAIGSLYTQEEVNGISRKFVNLSLFLPRRQSWSTTDIILLPKENFDILVFLNSSVPVIINDVSLWLTEPSEMDDLKKQWHGTLEVELMHSKISKLPACPDCPRLKLLTLQSNAGLKKMPPLFFNCMPLLQVLNLSYTGIRDLPNSFFNLLELRELYLRGCALLMELPPGIGNLKKLEKLDLDGTEILHLPREIQQLTNLQSLVLSFCGYPCPNVDRGKKKSVQESNSMIIPPGVISSLSELVHLSIHVSPDDARWYEEARVIFEEISKLKRLQTLSLYVPEVQLLEIILRCNARSLKLVVGRHMQHIISRVPPEVEAKFKRSDRYFKFINGVDIPNEINTVMGRAVNFFLQRHKMVKHLSQFMVNLLQVCILAECNEMEAIFDGNYMHGCKLSQLQSLTVFCMRNLKNIWVGPSPPLNIFLQLRSLALHNCPSLTTIFTTTLISSLFNLEELIVENCPKVTTVVNDSPEMKPVPLSVIKLRKVSLVHLPELVNISNGSYLVSLQKIGFYNCPKLESLSMSELSSPSLRVIRGEIEWWENLKWGEAGWEKPSPPDHLHKIFYPINKKADIMTQLVTDDIKIAPCFACYKICGNMDRDTDIGELCSDMGGLVQDRIGFSCSQYVSKQSDSARSINERLNFMLPLGILVY